MGPQGLELCEVTPAGVEACSAPRAASIDARAGQSFVLRGEGFMDSEPFRLDEEIGKVTISASPARRSTQVFGVVLMAIGSAATLGCGIGLPVAVQSGTGAPGVGGCLAGGLISLGVGVPLFLSQSRTTYTFSSLGTLRF
jgi:hypothetical protein